jgi:hypothetical protein
VLTAEERLNQAFNHWIVHRTPLVTVKAAATLMAKSPRLRANEGSWADWPGYGMKLRRR